MKKKKVLLICVHNTARSQIAEAWLNQICGDEFDAQSAGLEPGTIQPLAIEVMREVGIDIWRKETRKVFDVWKSGQAGQPTTLPRYFTVRRVAVRPFFSRLPLLGRAQRESVMIFLLIVILSVYVFEYINGFHDAANAIATVVSTKVMTPRVAVIMAAAFNLLGALSGTAVAKTVGAGLLDTNYVT